MIPPQVFVLLSKYGAKAGMLLAASIILGIVYYKIYNSGFDSAVAKYEKRDAETQVKVAKLMQVREAEVDRENNELKERTYNAVKVYADHNLNLQSDVDRLTQRMRVSTKTSCRVDPVPRSGNDNQVREAENNEPDRRIAQTAIELANLCEMQINRLEVAE